MICTCLTNKHTKGILLGLEREESVSKLPVYTTAARGVREDCGIEVPGKVGEVAIEEIEKQTDTENIDTSQVVLVV